MLFCKSILVNILCFFSLTLNLKVHEIIQWHHTRQLKQLCDDLEQGAFKETRDEAGPLENLTSHDTTSETQNEQKQSRPECPDPAGPPDPRGESSPRTAADRTRHPGTGRSFRRDSRVGFHAAWEVWPTSVKSPHEHVDVGSEACGSETQTAVSGDGVCEGAWRGGAQQRVGC